MAGDEEGRRKVRLYCPSVSKILDWFAWNDQKLDLGSIAAAFGLEPSTVKLNGHFISRGIDLVSSCVTWQSLLAFFSAKGLSTGTDDSDALLVHGKISQLGSKRARSDHPESLTCNNNEDLGLIRNKKLKDGESLIYRCNKRKLMPADSLSLKKLKLGDSLTNGCNKRKLMSEDPLYLKKLKLGESLNYGCNKRKLTSQDSLSLKKLKPNMDDSFGTQGGVSASGSPLKCTFISNGLKRIREVDMISSPSCKKIK